LLFKDAILLLHWKILFKPAIMTVCAAIVITLIEVGFERRYTMWFIFNRGVSRANRQFEVM